MTKEELDRPHIGHHHLIFLSVKSDFRYVSNNIKHNHMCGLFLLSQIMAINLHYSYLTIGLKEGMLVGDQIVRPEYVWLG